MIEDFGTHGLTHEPMRFPHGDGFFHTSWRGSFIMANDFPVFP